MRRLHLIEIAEQPWCPRPVRDGLTDYLQFVIDRGRPYAAAAPLLAGVLRAALDERAGPAGAAPGSPEVADVVDLGSGAGGPWPSLAPALAALGAPVRVRLTDLYPNVEAFARLARESGGAITGDPRPVRADAVPADLPGVRTIFSAFHHFRPTEARRVLADATRRGSAIAVFEATRRDVPSILLTLLTPLLVLLGTPLVRPFRWSRLFWTYVVPAIPLVVLFDGIVSCLRTYTPDELRALAAGLAGPGAEQYAWKSGEVRNGPIPMTYLAGYVAAPPRSEAQAVGLAQPATPPTYDPA